jgi:Flp pilus assembly protein TadD
VFDLLLVEALLARADGDAPAAEAAFREAQRVAGPPGEVPTSPLGIALARARRRLDPGG